MKKFITIMLALIMSVSVATLFTACGEEHAHTYASEWTSDDTNHWHVATCEHTDLVSDKAAHDYGTDGKCTVCQKAKPAVTTTTSEVWTDKIEGMQDLSNAKIVADMTSNGAPQTSELLIDGSKMAMTAFTGAGKVFAEASILVITGESTYDFYFKQTENGAYAKIEPEIFQIMSYTSTISAFVEMAQIAKDKFADATYDATTKTYALEVGDATVNGLGSVTGLAFVFGFADGELSDVQIEFSMVQGQNNLSYDIDFDFGGITITIPQV